MKSRLRHFLAKFSCTNKSLLTIQTEKLKKRQRKLSEKLAAELKVEFFGVKELKTLVDTKYKANTTEICHIIGSGWSLNQSISSISENDFVIGFNQAAISGIKSDLYFVEFGSVVESDITEKQFKLVQEVIKPHTDFVFFKNLWAMRNDYNVVRDTWNTNVRYVNDIPVNCYNAKFLSQSLDVFLEDDPVFIRQYSSTALTLVKLAKDLGFKKIVLHGIDFGGKYFFDANNFDDKLGLKKYLPNRSEQNIYKKANSKSTHITSKDSFGLKYALPIVKQRFEEKGVDLYAGTEISPLSKVLPVYPEYLKSIQE